MKEHFNVKEYEFLNPKIDEIHYLVNRADENCKIIFFFGLYINVILTLKL